MPFFTEASQIFLSENRMSHHHNLNWPCMNTSSQKRPMEAKEEVHDED